MSKVMSSIGDATVRVQLKGLLAVLSVEYILGVALTTIISYDPAKPTTVQTIFLVSHIVLAIGILAGAIVQVVLALRRHRLLMLSTVGILSVVSCLISGSLAARGGSDIAVFLMAIFFFVAMLCYGRSLMVTK